MTPSACRRFHDLWDAYRAGELSLSEIEYVERHLCICETCRETFSLINGVERAVQHMEMDPFVLRRIAVTASAPRRSRPSNRPWLGRPSLFAASAFTALLLAAGLAVFLKPPTSNTHNRENSILGAVPRAASSDTPSLYPVARFETDGRRIVEVFPGTAVYLSEDAEVDTIALAPEEVRFHLKRGTLVAEIGGHGFDFRFVISTKISEIEARGTLFSVELQSDGTEVTRVLEGVVEVRESRTAKSTVLEAGEAVVSASGTLSRQKLRPRDIDAVHCRMSGCAAPEGRPKRSAVAVSRHAGLSEKTKQAEQAVKQGRLAEAAKLTDEIYAASPKSRDAVRLLSQLARAYRRAKKFDDAGNIYIRILNAFPSSRVAADSLVALGQLEYRTLNRPEDALRRFEAYLRDHPSGFLSETARAEKIRVLHSLKRRRQVLAAAKEYLDAHTSGFNLAEILIKKADALTYLGRCSEAAPVYQKIIAGWPGSSESAKAKKRLDKCRSFLSPTVD